MSQPSISQRGRDWFNALCGQSPLQQGLPPSLLVTNILLLAAGNFMDPSAIVLIMAPILYPVAV
ncbi:TRAP transporter large permease subunit, partial [Aquitalea magnusonii]|uniref:TRAP transporter large permease subunit n=1 Tax=Aquitalea magnusonii TaxID=332411 RepID=UPI0023BA625B